MEITKELYGGVGSILGAIFGALIALYGAIRKQRSEKMSNDIRYLCTQLLSYYELERIYADKVSSLSAEKMSPNRVKVLMRNEVEAMSGLDRPGVTRAKIRNFLQN